MRWRLAPRSPGRLSEWRFRPGPRAKSATNLGVLPSRKRQVCQVKATGTRGTCQSVAEGCPTYSDEGLFRVCDMTTEPASLRLSREVSKDAQLWSAACLAAALARWSLLNSPGSRNEPWSAQTSAIRRSIAESLFSHTRQFSTGVPILMAVAIPCQQSALPRLLRIPRPPHREFQRQPAKTPADA